MKYLSRSIKSWLVSAGLLVLLTGLVGCGSYELSGRVVQGRAGIVQSVDAAALSDHPSSAVVAVSGARVEVVLEPDTAGRKVIAHAVTGDDGRFTATLDLMGAGFLEYKYAIYVRAAGYQPVFKALTLPSGSQQLKVTMSPGQDKNLRRGTLHHDLELERYLPKSPPPKR